MSPKKATIAMAVHGGAGPDSDFIKQHKAEHEEGLKKALTAGYGVLEKGGTALDAVEAAVCSLEDNEFFNAGRGSAINHKGEVEMDASIMDGKTKKAGAVSMVKNVKNPITLAKFIMNNTHHVLLSGNGALEFAKAEDIALETDAYFISSHQYDLFLEERDTQSIQELLKQRVHGTVGAVAVDTKGNVAAATSTGGTTNSLDGRIGDSCIIGAGCFADNATCAVSGTGDGEYLITGVVAHAISEALRYTQCSLQEACDLVIQEYHKATKGNMGVISVNARGEIGISFNSQRMHRAWQSETHPLQVRIYDRE
ncbi:isoaspartyl peptidase/L-asparaginase family protein [Runella slithyformis]|uniref:Isoaspartyl peptidase n=1 Tax=Runella slithyformis (strain ATCC 29530 / DSM 19594 / LMG 11500 / NCIMB 11436 / LSU 4) TaxID=761193 RepID=A0A7U4E7P7_RUNSL|nr:isoaspartyl peptidase/L-asparaginase [Runella slithyformis]AEI50604.1 Beta-aspartyl-peptidase [Runella slithyformis DSM 19594]